MPSSPYHDASPSTKFPRIDAVEMAEVSSPATQRLLDVEGAFADDDNVEYRVEWHLRTGWAVFGSLLCAILVFCALILFTKVCIVS